MLLRDRTNSGRHIASGHRALNFHIAHLWIAAAPTF